MSDCFKDKINNIEVPDRLDTAIKAAINQARKDKSKRKQYSRIVKLSTAAALLVFFFGISVNSSPTFANSIKSIPVISQLAKALQMNLNGNIQKAVANGMSQNITVSKSDSGVKFTIDDIVTDNTRIVIFYTMEVEEGLGNLKNLYVKNFNVTDKNNNILVSTNNLNKPSIQPGRNQSDGSSDYLRITEMSGGKEGFSGMILSSEKLNKDFSKTNKAYGSIEIFPRYDTKDTPNEFNLQVTDITETATLYMDELINDTYSSEAFMQKYGREAISIKGNWSFHIKLNVDFKNTKPKEYNCNKDFDIADTEFNVESIKISPLRTDLKMTWKNGIKEFEPVTMKYHLEDNKGNKYFNLRGRAYNPSHTINIVFESCYFDETESLYLVVDEIKYVYFDNRNDIKKFGPIKIKIK